MASVWASSKRSPPPNFVFHAIRCKRQRIGADPADPADPPELSDPADPVELSDPADPADPASLFDLLDKDVLSTIVEFLDIHEIASARLVDKTFLSATPPSWEYLKRCGHLSFERVCCALNVDEVDGKLDAGELAFWEDRIGPNRFDALMRSQAVQSGNYVALVRFNAADRAADRADRADRWLREDSNSSADEYTDSSDSVAKYSPPRIFVSPLNLAAFARNPAAPLSFFVEKMDSLLLDSETRGEFEILLDVSVSCLFEAVRAGRAAEIVSFFSDIATDIVSDERKHCNVFRESDNVAILLSKCVAASAIRRSEAGKGAVIRIATAYRACVMARARAGGDDGNAGEDALHVRRKETEQRILWERGLSYIFSDFFQQKPSDPTQFDFLVSVLSSVFRLVTMRNVFDAQKIGLLNNPEFASKLFRQRGWSNDGSDNWFGRVDEWYSPCPNCLVNLASKTDALAAILQTVPSRLLTRKATCVSHEAFVRSTLSVRPTRIVAETLFYAGIAHLRGALMMLPLSFRTRSSVLQINSFALALLRLCCADKYDYVIGRCNREEKARLLKAMVEPASFKKAFLRTNRCHQELDVHKRSRFLIRLLEEETGLQRWEPLWAAHAAHAGYDTFVSWAIGRQLHISDATKKTISTSDTLPVSFVMLLKRGYPLPSYVPCPRTGLEFDRVRALAKAGALHHLLHVNRLSLFFPEVMDIIEKTGPFRLGV